MHYEEVRVRDCACPDTPHEDGDVVYLNPKLSAAGGIAAEQVIVPWIALQSKAKVGPTGRPTEAAFPPDLTNQMLVAFVRNEAVGWNLTETDGQGKHKLRPFDVEELLSDWSLARLAVARAGELYTETAIAPFQSKPAERSPTGRTPATTSQRRTRTSKPSASP